MNGSIGGSAAPGASVPPEYLAVIGHAGQDYGSGAPLHYYNKKLDLAIVMAIASDVGLNCSDLAGASQMSSEVECVVYSAVLLALTNNTIGPLQCGDAFAADVLHTPATLSTVPLATLAAPRPASASALALDALAALGASLASRSPLAVGHITLCEQDAQCTGSSAGLKRGDCIAWMDLWLATNGSGWTRCNNMATDWRDPCGCAGAVTCTGNEITALTLGSIGMAIGPFPEQIATLAGLKALDISDNAGLAATALPNLHFASYTMGCDLHGNGFSCPLPAAAAQCKPSASSPPVDVQHDCVGPPISVKCYEAVIAIYQDSAYVAASQKLSSDLGLVFQGPSVQSCIQPLLARANHTCNAAVMWSAEPFKSDWAALVAALAAKDPTAQQCRIGATLSVDLGSVVGKLNFVNGLIPAPPLPAACGRMDRANFASSEGRNYSVGSTLHFTTLVDDACTLARPSADALQRAAVAASVAPPAVLPTAPPVAARGAAARIALAAGAALPRSRRGGAHAEVARTPPRLQRDHRVLFGVGSSSSGLPPLSEECLQGTIALLENPGWTAKFDALMEKAISTLVEPAVAKCELQFLLLGKCEEHVDWSSLASDVTAVTVAAGVISPGAQLCNFDVNIDDVNNTAHATHPVLHYNVTRYESFPVAAACTTTDRNRMMEWLASTGQEKEESCNFYYSWSDPVCAVQQ